MVRLFHSRRGCIQLFVSIAALVCLTLMCFVPLFAQNPGESRIEVTLPNGRTVTLTKIVTQGFIWYRDENNYSLIKAKDRYEYAKLDPTLGHFLPTGLIYGEADPQKAGIVPGLRYSSRVVRSVRGPDESAEPKDQEALGEFNVLVIPIRFADHKEKELPDRKVYDRILNKNGGDPEYAPKGTVRDYLREVSYNQFVTSAYVLPWIDVPKDEAYYASNAVSEGIAAGNRIDEAVHYALDVIDSDPEFKSLNLRELFDRNHDGYLDAVAFLHSGYGKEARGPDADGRIQSQQYKVTDWTSKTGMKARYVAVVSGLQGLKGSTPSRIGLLCHEGAHFAGLPDLYEPSSLDRSSGKGIGYWGLMSLHWGVDESGEMPLHMSAWEKVQLGWVTPTVISEPGEYAVRAVEKYPDIYKIEYGFPRGEYLLIENRQPIGFDAQIPAGKDGERGGLAIWHIDDRKHSNSDGGYPGAPGFPQNNAHYRVALLQADGEYHLEKPSGNQGDGDDLFRGPHKAIIGPHTIPNTKSYQLGAYRDTGVVICDISPSGTEMTFRVDFLPPSSEPERSEPAAVVSQSVPGSMATSGAVKKPYASPGANDTKSYTPPISGAVATQVSPAESTVISGATTILEHTLDLSEPATVRVSAIAQVKPLADKQLIGFGISTDAHPVDFEATSSRVATGQLDVGLELRTKTVLSLPRGRSVLRLRVVPQHGQLELLSTPQMTVVPLR